ncbi:hypothetical protein HKI87_03g24060 [Chloropicon roscoffensis]|uniref:Uncharacterized protein n=1 Tax=Chloropicon roscoffensis TaxID=1461544 RepID=A0AAX4P4P3_9CHLO
MAGDDAGEHLSLAFQFVASFCWALGAGLAGPASDADYLQFAAALAWCVANFAGAWSMGWFGHRVGEDGRKNGGTFSSMRRLMSSTSADGRKEVDVEASPQ